jgi:hypothetical protein
VPPNPATLEKGHPLKGSCGSQRQRLASAIAVAGLLLGLSDLRAPLAAQGLADYDYEDLEFRGIGVEAGHIWPERVEPVTTFGLRLDLGLIGPRIRIVPSARFWSSSLEEREVDRLAEQIVEVCQRQGDVNCPTRLDLGQVDLSDLELTTDAQVLLLNRGPVTPYLGFSAGLHLLNGRGDFIDNTFVEDLLDTVSPGIGASLGSNVRIVSALELGIEARFTLASDVRYAGVGAVGVWTLPRPAPDQPDPSQLEQGR